MANPDLECWEDQSHSWANFWKPLDGLPTFYGFFASMQPTVLPLTHWRVKEQTDNDIDVNWYPLLVHKGQVVLFSESVSTSQWWYLKCSIFHSEQNASGRGYKTSGLLQGSGAQINWVWQQGLAYPVYFHHTSSFLKINNPCKLRDFKTNMPSLFAF